MMDALYLHIPFCRRKCPYCDFYSLDQAETQRDEYPDLLIRHLRFVARRGLSQGPFATVFFGGGTPSLLSPAAVESILTAADREFGLEAGAEISLEANPGTLSRQSLGGYRRAGITRLSLGVQSLQPRNLRFLERPHDIEDARRAVHWAKEAGFDDLSLDLMFALPEQGLDDLEEEVEAYLALSPDHISCYGLSIEDETPFASRHRCGELSLPDEDRYADAFLFLDRRLSEAGFAHYEISNYARPGHECRHNLRYWRRQSFLGIGAGAHSFRAYGWGERWSVPGDLELYRKNLDQERDPAELLESFDQRSAMAETLYLGLRTAEGVDNVEFRRRFGAGVAELFPDAVRRCGAHLRISGGRVRFTAEGWLLYDHLISLFL